MKKDSTRPASFSPKAVVTSGLRIQSGVKAAGPSGNHNETQLRIKSGVQSLFIPLVLASLLAAGCGVADESEELAGEARQAQIGIGYLNARRVRFTFADHNRTPFAELHVLTHPAGARVPGTEYWYVNRSATRLLATTPLDIAVEDLTADPPDPDYPDEQSFTEAEFPANGWGSGWTTDPLSYGRLLGNGNGIYLRLDTSASSDVTRVGWYQVIPTSQSPQYLTPSGRFTSSGTRVSVPSGYRGYDIDQPAE